MPLELVLTWSGQIFPASEEKSFVLLGWISSNGTRLDVIARSKATKQSDTQCHCERSEAISWFGTGLPRANLSPHLFSSPSRGEEERRGYAPSQRPFRSIAMLLAVARNDTCNYPFTLSRVGATLVVALKRWG